VKGRGAAVLALALAGALVALPARLTPGPLGGPAWAEHQVSDADGFYVIVARLGDESAGETLHVRAESQAVTVTARFDPTDHTTERGTRVDFTARRSVESPTAFAGTLKRYLAQ
jgi:hypothetical protein